MDTDKVGLLEVRHGLLKTKKKRGIAQNRIGFLFVAVVHRLLLGNFLGGMLLASVLFCNCT